VKPVNFDYLKRLLANLESGGLSDVRTDRVHA